MISVIVPTIGRPASLSRLLASLALQVEPVGEIIVADGSSDSRTAAVIAEPRWAAAGLNVTRIEVLPPHAVRQRNAALAVAKGDCFLLLDDDVELEPTCVQELVRALESNSQAVAVMADFNNQEWPMPPMVWRIYLRLVHGLRQGEWQGRVIGPLLRYAFSPSPTEVRQSAWFATCNSLVLRSAFEAAGGFSDFFLHRSTMNEDVDLALRVARQGDILFTPYARLGHFHDPGGRVSVQQAAEDDLFNRYHILRKTCGHSVLGAFGLVVLFLTVEALSNCAGSLLRLRWGQTGLLLTGRVAALGRIVFPPDASGSRSPEDLAG